MRCSQACRQRAAGYDRDNKFCQEDFDELKAAGYLKLTMPKEFGGQGYTLNQYTREARRLAQLRAGDGAVHSTCTTTGSAPPPTAGAPATSRSGSSSRMPPQARSSPPATPRAATRRRSLMSITKAEKVAGGYKFTGRKSFGSLTPVWTRLGLHGMDTSDPKNPKVVHGFLPRNTPACTIKETWDVMGMRATRSDDTVLEGAFVPDKYIARVVPAGLAGADYFVLSIFAWALRRLRQHLLRPRRSGCSS